MKTFLHKAFRTLGFDIVSVQNMERDLALREQERQKAQWEHIQSLRQQQKGQRPRSRGEVIWTSADDFVNEAVKRMDDADVVLDIGCAFRPQQYVDARIHICCEPFQEYMDRLLVETAAESKYVYLKADMTTASQLLPEASVDSVFMVDVLEHIDRETGQKGLAELKSIARSQIILFTPLGYMEQDPGDDGLDPWGMGGAKWQRHLSGWVPEDFPADEGWIVIACKEFHTVDGYGRKLDKPFGQLWAIWNAT